MLRLAEKLKEAVLGGAGIEDVSAAPMKSIHNFYILGNEGFNSLLMDCKASTAGS
jgi:hypothetical protein